MFLISVRDAAAVFPFWLQPSERWVCGGSCSSDFVKTHSDGRLSSEKDQKLLLMSIIAWKSLAPSSQEDT